MSESSFPFDAAPMEADVMEEGGGRRPVVLVGGVLAAVVLAAGGFFAFSGGGDDAEEDFSVPVRAPQAAAPAESAPAPVAVVPAAATDAVFRNPFKVLYVEPKAAAAGPGTTMPGAPTGNGSVTTGGTGAGTGGTTGGTTTGGTGGAGGTGGTGAPAEQPKTAPKYLTVVSVDPGADQVTFQLVDRTAEPDKRTQSVVVKPGEVFATYFKLLGYGELKDSNDVLRRCTDLQYGDTLLKLCEGESYQMAA